MQPLHYGTIKYTGSGVVSTLLLFFAISVIYTSKYKVSVLGLGLGPPLIRFALLSGISRSNLKFEVVTPVRSGNWNESLVFVSRFFTKIQALSEPGTKLRSPSASVTCKVSTGGAWPDIGIFPATVFGFIVL